MEAQSPFRISKEREAPWSSRRRTIEAYELPCPENNTGKLNDRNARALSTIDFISNWWLPRLLPLNIDGFYSSTYPPVERNSAESFSVHKKTRKVLIIYAR